MDAGQLVTSAIALVGAVFAGLGLLLKTRSEARVAEIRATSEANWRKASARQAEIKSAVDEVRVLNAAVLAGIAQSASASASAAKATPGADAASP